MHSPIAGFPTTLPEPGFVSDLDADPVTGNIFYVSRVTGLYGFDEAGLPLPSPKFPVRKSGEANYGVAVDPQGFVWVVDHEANKIKQYEQDGTPTGRSIDVSDQTFAGAIKFDRSNGDLYVSQNVGTEIWRYTAASNYTDGTRFQLIQPEFTYGLAVDPGTHVVYSVGSFGHGVQAYRPDGELIETIANGVTPSGVAVNPVNHTVYVSDPETHRILVFPAVIVPNGTTGDQTGFATLNGHVDPDGGPPITECKFEYGEFHPGTGSTVYTDSAPCSQGLPINSASDVSADLTGKVTEEQTYDYRLIVGNANGKNHGQNRQFTPHFVHGLQTEAPTGVSRESATLTGSFIGTNEETKYSFELGTSPDALTTVTPTQEVGKTTGPTPLSFPLAPDALKAGVTYYYRVSASNGQGASKANIVEFTTSPAVTGLETDPATNVEKEGAELNGHFTGEGIDTKYFFEYGSSDTYGKTTTVIDAGTAAGPVTATPAQLSELVPNKTYHFRFVAENSFGTTHGQDRSFTTTSPPAIVAVSSSNVTANSVDLNGVINSRNAETTYYFEYGTSPAYGSKSPAETIPAGTDDVERSVHLSNLQSVVYHFRLVAENAYGKVVSQDQVFSFYPEPCPNETVRQQTGADLLPDCRAYELVTPEDAGNILVYPANSPFSPTATSPSRVTYVGAFGVAPGAEGAANVLGDLYGSTRTNRGWTQKFIGIPATKAFLSGGPAWIRYYKQEPDKMDLDVLANSSLSRVVEWDNGSYPCPDPEGKCYELAGGPGQEASNAPYIYDTTTGKQVDRWPTSVGAIPNGEHFLGQTSASADLSHFVFSSDIPFVPGAPAGAVYDNNTVTESVEVISFNEKEEPLSGAVPVELSKNGSHVLMTVGGERRAWRFTDGPGVLYMRVDDQSSFDVSKGKAVEYVDMTADGKKVYFTSSEKLTDNDTDNSIDLYMWDEESSEPGHLVLVSKGNDGVSGNSDNCNASWIQGCGAEAIYFTSNVGTGGVNEGAGYSSAQAGTGGSPYSDSSVAENGDIYFLSPEQLVGDSGSTGAQNLYDFREGHLQFVAALEPGALSCTHPQQQSTVCSDTAVARMNISPDDSHMAFLSASQVTGYDNDGHSEMYTYSAPLDEVLCVSCIPSGATPAADVTTSHNGRFMTDDGRTFFSTVDALVPHDTNEVDDVYEFANGHPYLISSGTAAGYDVFGVVGFGTRPGLLGVSADGTDVYFATFDVLVGQDRNGDAIKIYDARSGGGFPFTPPPPGCAAADECHGPSSSAATPPTNGTGAGLGVSGNVQSKQTKSPAKKGGKKKSKKAKKHHRKAKKKGGRRHG